MPFFNIVRARVVCACVVCARVAVCVMQCMWQHRVSRRFCGGRGELILQRAFPNGSPIFVVVLSCVAGLAVALFQLRN